MSAVQIVMKNIVWSLIETHVDICVRGENNEFRVIPDIIIPGSSWWWEWW